MCPLIRCIFGVYFDKGVPSRGRRLCSGDFMERSQYLIGKQDVEQKGSDNCAFQLIARKVVHIIF